MDPAQPQRAVDLSGSERPEPESAPDLIAPPPALEEPYARAMRVAAMRAVLLAAFLVAAGMLFQELVTLIAVGVITIIFAILFTTVAEPLERLGVPRPLGALAGVLLFLGTLGGILALLVPTLVAQLQEFGDELPEVINGLAGQIATITGGDSADVGQRVERSMERLSEDPGRFLGPLASIGLGVAGVVSAFLVILITAFYMAAQPGPLVNGVLRLFPPARRDWATCVLERLRVAWTGWLKGVLLDMAVTGVLLYVGLLLIGLPFAELFAALSALLVVVPYFGAIAAAVPPVLFGLTESPQLGLLAGGVYLLVQQIEGNVILPLVMARVVKLHPAVIAIGVIVVSQLFGLVGLLVAVPLCSAFVILVEEIWVRPLEQRRGIAAPQTLAVDRGGDGRWRRLRRERLEREDSLRRGRARLRGEDPELTPAATEALPEASTARFLTRLALPALALGMAMTTVVAFVPVIIDEHAGPLTIGALIGAAGLFALAVPTAIGSRASGRRARMTLLLAAAPVATAVLVLITAAESLLALALLLGLFYGAFFTYREAYRALSDEIVPPESHERWSTARINMREMGAGATLVAGGVLLGLWEPLPYAFAAAVLAAATVILVLKVRGVENDSGRPDAAGLTAVPALLRKDPDLRRTLVVNALLSAALAAVSAFAVLYLTDGHGRSLTFASLALGTAALAAAAGGLLANRPPRRFDGVGALRGTLIASAAGLATPLLAGDLAVLVALPLTAFTAGVVLLRPDSPLAALLPQDRRSASEGVVHAGRALGLLAGPVLAGVAIALFGDGLPAAGYSAAFGVAAAAVLAAIPLLRRAE